MGEQPGKEQATEQPEGAGLNPDKIQDQIKELIDKYTVTVFREGLNEYATRVARIAVLNAKLADQETRLSEEEYNGQVQRIITETQDYYTFLGKQPKELRQFFFQLTGDDGNLNFKDLTIEVGEGFPLGLEVPLGPSPLLRAQAIRPRNYIMQIDAITNQLAFLEDTTQLRVGNRRNQPVRTTVTLDIPDNLRIEGGGELTTYDKSIINGVTSLLESGNTVFSIPMLYHAMTGRHNPTVDEVLQEEIGTKLEKMRRMMLTIDLTEEAQAEFLLDSDGQPMAVDHLEIEGYLLPLNKVSGVINGKRTELYQIIQHPPLYAYSKLRRQLASVDISLLGAPVNNNSTTIPLKTYLLQRIELMKNKKNKITQTNILYESIYQELGVQEAGKTKKMRIRTYTTTILAHFVEQNYIQSYVEYKKGRSIAGIYIYI